MGYAYYEIMTPDGKPMKRGYGVRCKCHARGCKEKIDRGMGYLCYECTWYFCGNHLEYAKKHVECFAGSSRQVCVFCLKKKTTGN